MRPVPRGATFTLQPVLGFLEEYSDNFNISAQNRTSNFRSMITPGVSVLMDSGPAQGAVAASLGIAQDSVNSFGDLSLFGSLSGSLQYAVSPRLTVYLADTLIRSDQPSLADEFGLRQERDTFTSNTLSLSADWLLDLVAVQGYYQLSTFVSDSETVANVLGVNAGTPIGGLMAVRAGYELSFSETSGSISSESTGNLFWASLARQLTPLARGGVSSTYSLQSLNGARIWNGSLFTTYELPTRLSLSASVGYSHLSSDAGRDFSTISSNATVSYRFAKALISVGIFQDFVPTFTQGEDFGITLTRSYSGSVTYSWTPLIDTLARASYSENEVTDVGNTTGNTNTFSVQAGLAWRARRWLSLGLDYTYSRYDRGAQSSGGATWGVATENRVALRVIASF